MGLARNNRPMVTHLATLFKAGQVRFRMEAYGLYYPSTPEKRPVWRAAPAAIPALLRSLPAYVTWVRQARQVQMGGAHEWWGRQWPGIDIEGELKRQYPEVHQW